LQPKLAYLLSQYPTIGHTYLLRELRGVRSLGWDIPTVSIRPPDRGPDTMLGHERDEAARTFYVLRAGGRRFLLDHLRAFFTRPARYLSALTFAIRIGRFHPKETLYSLAYFAEAVVAGAWMLRRGATHFHSHFSTTAGLLITKLFPLSMSMTIHGPEEFVDPAGALLPEKIRASAFICAISYFAQSQMMQLVPHELWDRFEITPLGIDPSEYEPAPFRESPKPFEVCCVGRLTPFKAQHILIESVHRLIKEGRNVRLRLVGDGPDRAGLEARIAALGLRSCIFVEGWKNQSEVRELYRRADAFALASSAEGVPVVLMEAMAMQIPCVATRITGIPELIRDGVDGLLVTPSDPDELAAAIARLMDDVVLRQNLAQAGRIRVQEKYNLHTNVAKLAAVFERRLGVFRAVRANAGTHHASEMT
jgi:glycosyltransferase involved in cell wall biosynthesis